MNINYMIIQAREQVNDALKKLMSKDSKLTTLHIDKMATQIREEQRLANASTEEDDSLSDDDLDSPGDAEAAAKKLALKKKHSEESRRVREQNTISIGQIQIKSGGGSAGEGEKVKTKNIVFNVKSLRALQSNMGVFSIWKTWYMINQLINKDKQTRNLNTDWIVHAMPFLIRPGNINSPIFEMLKTSHAPKTRSILVD